MVDKSLTICFRMIGDRINGCSIYRSGIKVRKLFYRCSYRTIHPSTIRCCQMRPLIIRIIEYFFYDCSMTGWNYISLRIQNRVALIISFVVPPAYSSTKLRSITSQKIFSRCLKIPLISVSGRPFIIQGRLVIEFIKPSEGQV